MWRYIIRMIGEKCSGISISGHLSLQSSGQKVIIDIHCRPRVLPESGLINWTINTLLPFYKDPPSVSIVCDVTYLYLLQLRALFFENLFSVNFNRGTLKHVTFDIEIYMQKTIVLKKCLLTCLPIKYKHTYYKVKASLMFLDLHYNV